MQGRCSINSSAVIPGTLTAGEQGLLLPWIPGGWAELGPQPWGEVWWASGALGEGEGCIRREPEVGVFLAQFGPWLGEAVPP